MKLLLCHVHDKVEVAQNISPIDRVQHISDDRDPQSVCLRPRPKVRV